MKAKVTNTVCRPYSHAEGHQGVTVACEEGKENGGLIDIASHVQPPDRTRNPGYSGREVACLVSQKLRLTR